MDFEDKLYAFDGVAYNGDFMTDCVALVQALVNYDPELFTEWLREHQAPLPDDFVAYCIVQIKQNEAFRSSYDIEELKVYEIPE